MHKRKFLLVGILIVAMLVPVGVTGCTTEQLTALEGVIQNIDTVSGNVTVKMKDGSTQTFNFADVKAETIKEALGSLSIEPGDTVIIKEDENGDVQEIEGDYAEVDGIIKDLGADSIVITTEKRGDITLEVTPETVIRIEDEGTVDFADLQVSQYVEAKYDVTSLEALKLEVDIDEEEGEVEGIITAIDGANQTVTITAEEEGDITLQVTPDTRIRIEDKGTAAFADLAVGQQVEAEYDESSMDALKIKVDDDEDRDNDEEDEEDKEEENINDNGDEDNFEIEGTVESISSDGNSIVVNGQTIIIQGAEIEGTLTVGAVVEAEVAAQSDGSLVAQEIEVEDDDDEDDDEDEDDEDEHEDDEED